MNPADTSSAATTVLRAIANHPKLKALNGADLAAVLHSAAEAVSQTTMAAATIVALRKHMGGQ